MQCTYILRYFSPLENLKRICQLYYWYLFKSGLKDKGADNNTYFNDILLFLSDQLNPHKIYLCTCRIVYIVISYSRIQDVVMLSISLILYF